MLITDKLPATSSFDHAVNRAMERFNQLGAAHSSPRKLTTHELAGMIDHTQLKPEANRAMITQLCQEAAQYHFASVCVNPFNVAYCTELLKGTPVAVCSVTGFPLGATRTRTKVAEARRGIQDGASEIDMVLNVGALKDRLYHTVRRDIADVANACHDYGAKLKVILETCLLTDAEKAAACLLAQDAHADFVKTSTGLNSGGATVQDVRLMRSVVGDAMGVKAAGGIRNLETALAMIAAGATRLGASASVKIIAELV